MLHGSQTRSLTLMTGILLFLAALVEMITVQRLDMLVVAIGELMLIVSDGYRSLFYSVTEGMTTTPLTIKDTLTQGGQVVNER